MFKNHLAFFAIVAILLTSVPMHSAAPAPQQVTAADNIKDSEGILLAKSGIMFLSGIGSIYFSNPILAQSRKIRTNSIDYFLEVYLLRWASFLFFGISYVCFNRTEMCKNLKKQWSKKTYAQHQ